MGKLKSCQVCGSQGVVTYNTIYGFQVYCSNDDCILNQLIMKEMETEEQAIQAWNKIHIPITPIKSYISPNREQLESLLGKKVKIKLCNKSVLTGELHKTGEEQFENNSDLCYKPNYYFLLDENGELVDRTVFRVAFVRKVEVIENE